MAIPASLPGLESRPLLLSHQRHHRMIIVLRPLHTPSPPIPIPKYPPSYQEIQETPKFHSLKLPNRQTKYHKPVNEGQPKNGVYITLVRNVRQAFEESSLVKIDCKGMHVCDYKKIGAKLKAIPMDGTMSDCARATHPSGDCATLFLLNSHFSDILLAVTSALCAIVF
ncbi:hypothetical protein HS088_TW06G00762 [Tripterygium wilfordii]|uniref:Uncharacterized protein n=1 Tax=Tripterygium wilfordii TaxID=458696 RepID=A0A7J7DJT0_TRIWF|nr:hypothetical protein HS088_TW06G00762 [Tripterygium wilfordii]